MVALGIRRTVNQLRVGTVWDAHDLMGISNFLRRNYRKAPCFPSTLGRAVNLSRRRILPGLGPRGERNTRWDLGISHRTGRRPSRERGVPPWGTSSPSSTGNLQRRGLLEREEIPGLSLAMEGRVLGSRRPRTRWRWSGTSATRLPRKCRTPWTQAAPGRLRQRGVSKISPQWGWHHVASPSHADIQAPNRSLGNCARGGFAGRGRLGADAAGLSCRTFAESRPSGSKSGGLELGKFEPGRGGPTALRCSR